MAEGGAANPDEPVAGAPNDGAEPAFEPKDGVTPIPVDPNAGAADPKDGAEPKEGAALVDPKALGADEPKPPNPDPVPNGFPACCCGCCCCWELLLGFVPKPPKPVAVPEEA